MADAATLVLEPALPATAQWRGEDIAISPLGPSARWTLRLRPDAAERMREVAGFRIAIEINRCSAEDGKLAARLGPDEWLLCVPEDFATGLERSMTAVLDGAPHALVDVGHRYAALAIEGPQAPALLAAGCPLDLNPGKFGAGFVTRTLLGKAEIVLWRLRDAPVYRIECARSFAPYLHAFLLEASR